MLRIIIEQDSQAETHPRGRTITRLQHMPARNGGPPAVGPHYAIQSPLTLASQETAQHAGGTVQSAGPAPKILQVRRKS
ncbi:MAG: hypothetical protein H0W02_12690 [Ktedonobacteraceae bacterium]|nr:hypothetical protein [Ktedonobacteraceae bacterium]